MKNLHEKLPSVVYFVEITKNGETLYYGPYWKKGTAKGQATKWTKKGYTTYLMPYFGPIADRIEKYPKEEE